MTAGAAAIKCLARSSLLLKTTVKILHFEVRMAFTSAAWTTIVPTVLLSILLGRTVRADQKPG